MHIEIEMRNIALELVVHSSTVIAVVLIYNDTPQGMHGAFMAESPFCDLILTRPYFYGASIISCESNLSLGFLMLM